MRPILALLCLLALNACAAQTIGRIEAVNEQVERERADIVEYTASKLCKLPLSWVSDQMQRAGVEWGRGFLLMCPEVRATVTLLNSQIQPAPVFVPVPMTAAEIEALKARASVP